MSGRPRSSKKRSGGSERALLSASAGGRYCRKGRAKVVRYCAQKVGTHVLKLFFYGYLLAGIYKPLPVQRNACALHKLIHKGYHVRIAFFRAENYGYNAAYVLAEGDGGVAISKSTAAAHA